MLSCLVKGSPCCTGWVLYMRAAVTQQMQGSGVSIVAERYWGTSGMPGKDSAGDVSFKDKKSGELHHSKLQP
jgi:hypothetical protein